MKCETTSLAISGMTGCSRLCSQKGRQELDASTLLMPMMRFISPLHPMWLSTMKTNNPRHEHRSGATRYQEFLALR
jgi:GH15 family glucan-1,4-alpha-glucosidase